MQGSCGDFDLFISHGTPDKPWVVSLANELQRLGLRAFLDERELTPGQNWVIGLGEALSASRYLVLIVSSTSTGRPWVVQEWTSFMAACGPLGRIIPVKIDPVDLPPVLAATQALNALHRDANRVADELYQVVSEPVALDTGDARHPHVDRQFIFSLSRDDVQLQRVNYSGQVRTVPLPWRRDKRFDAAWLNWQRLASKLEPNDEERSALSTHARDLGEALFSLLFDAREKGRLKNLMTPGKPYRPVVTIRTNDDLLLSLPWELLCADGSFLVRDQRIDLVRTTVDDVAGVTLLRKPTRLFRLVVNVAAPEGSALSYEAESYRIALALADRCEAIWTELGTVEDLVETIGQTAPNGVHFSGHGSPGMLRFESDEGIEEAVSIGKLLDRLRARVPDEHGLPSFFYLASCHGNTLGRAEDGKAGSTISAAQLHRAGVTQVVGYFGPIGDEQSTRAEEALYDAIAAGRDTRYAVRQARVALAKCVLPEGDSHRPHAARTSSTPKVTTGPSDGAPFAWAQLVLYHRGPEYPLSTGRPAGAVPLSRELHRTFDGFGHRQVLRSGFVGRRATLHDIRRRVRQGERVIVIQGLGGLGKSTVAAHLLPMLADKPEQCWTLWCQEAESEADPAAALVTQLHAYGHECFGTGWSAALHEAERSTDPAERFVRVLRSAARRLSRIVLHFDNLDSLLVGPGHAAAGDSFGTWASPTLRRIWERVSHLAAGAANIYILASTRYRPASFSGALIPLSPMPLDAMFRLTAWFPALRRLSVASRARLVARLHGQPLAVEYANTLIGDALQAWASLHGEWTSSSRPGEEIQQQEWDEIVEPALPDVEVQLGDDLLLSAIWERVLGEPERRMLYRMAVLRRPAARELMALLGNEDEARDASASRLEKLLGTSLVTRFQLSEDLIGGGIRRTIAYGLHPVTKRFVQRAFAGASEDRRSAHRRLGELLEGRAEVSPNLETTIEAGHHLLEAGFRDRAIKQLRSAAGWFNEHDRPGRGLDLLLPFISESVHPSLPGPLAGAVLSTVGRSFLQLSKAEEAVKLIGQAIGIFREFGERDEEARALDNLGTAYASLGQQERALDAYERELAIYRTLHDRMGESVAIGNSGLAYAGLGQHEEAIGLYERQLALVREIAHRVGEGNALMNMGSSLDQLGQSAKAIQCYEQAVATFRADGYSRGEGQAIAKLGRACTKLGRFEQAISYLEQALVIWRRLRSGGGVVATLQALGAAYAASGQGEMGMGYRKQALAVVREAGDRHGELSVTLDLGLDCLRLEQPKKALGLLEDACAIAREIGKRTIEGHAVAHLGLAHVQVGQLDNAIECLEGALAIAHETSDRDLELLAAGNLGSSFADQGNGERAIEHAERALALAREVGNRSAESHALQSMGLASVDLGQPERAVAFNEKALAIIREVGDRRAEAITLGNLGKSYAILGRLEKARGCFEQALVIFREVEDRIGQLSTLANLCTAYEQMGQTRTTIGFREQALVISRETDNLQEECVTLSHLGFDWARLGDLDKAITYSEQALAISRDIEDCDVEAKALYDLGVAHSGLGHFKEAIAYFEDYLKSIGELGASTRERAAVLGLLGTCYIVSGQPAMAIGSLERALAANREAGDRQAEGDVLAVLGHACGISGEPMAAADYFEQALVISREEGNRKIECDALMGLGITHSGIGEFELASGYLEQVLMIARESDNGRLEGAALLSLGHAYTELGREGKAISYYESAAEVGREMEEMEVVDRAMNALGSLRSATDGSSE